MPIIGYFILVLFYFSSSKPSIIGATMASSNLSLFLFHFLHFPHESLPIQYASDGESEREGDPDALNAQAARKTKRVAQWQGDDEVGDEGIRYHRFDAGDASQGVGEGILQAVAKLIHHHPDDEHRHVLLHLHVVVKPSAYLMAQEEHGDAHQRREHQGESPAIVGVAANGGKILLSHEVAHSDGHRSRHTRKHEVEELREGNHHLVRSQRDGAQPAYHHAAQRERRRLHRQLQSHRPAQAVHLLEVSLVGMALDDVEAILPELASAHHHAHHRRSHQDAREEGGETGAEQTQLRKRSHAIDEHPVAQDVGDVAGYHHPHRHLGMGDTIEELLHRIEYAHEEHGYEVDDEVGADERQQLLGLPDMGEVEVEDDEGDGEDAAHHHVSHERVSYLLSDFIRSLHAVELADDRGETVGESHVGDKDQSEDIVHQSCRRQFLRAVMSYHERVGEAEDDGSQLTNDDRYADGEQCPIMMLVSNGCRSLLIIHNYI